MVIWFLRLFSQFRDLQAKLLAWQKWKESTVKTLDEIIEKNERGISEVREAYNAEVQEHIRTRDRLDAALLDRQKLWEQMERALNGERAAYQMQINIRAQKAGEGLPFPEAYSLPDESVPKPRPTGPMGRSGRILPSQRAAQAQREVLEVIANNLPE
jgi:hypothetical protein